MWKRLGIGLCAVLIGGASVGAAQGKVVACSLLTASDIAAAVGGPAAVPHENDQMIPNGPHRGETVPMCNWQVGQEGMITLSPLRVASDADLAAVRDTMRQPVDVLKAQGWSEEKKTLAGVECYVLTPPHGQKDAPLTTGCFSASRGKGASVSWLGRRPVPMERIKALYDAAVGRLP